MGPGCINTGAHWLLGPIQIIYLKNYFLAPGSLRIDTSVVSSRFSFVLSFLNYFKHSDFFLLTNFGAPI